MITVSLTTFTGVKDSDLTNIFIRMMRYTLLQFMLLAIFCLISSCKNATGHKVAALAAQTVSDSTGIILVGKDMITDIVLKPDSTGDPWELEKVKGFSGEKMFRTLFDHIYKEKLTVYDCREEKVLKTSEIKKLEKEFDSDLSRIGKVQFTEDWYFDMNRNIMVKKIKSFAFGFSMEASGPWSARYKALFRIKE